MVNVGEAIANFFGAGTISKTVGTIGKGVGNILNRVGFTEKMSEADKAKYTLEIFKASIDSDQLDNDDLKSAREMAITQMRTQKASWLVRNLNGSLRPAAGWWALACMTDKWWGQFLTSSIHNFTWIPIVANQEEKFILAGILTFFFGFRQRAKEKKVNLDA